MKCTRVNCSLTDCKFNSSCCLNPVNGETYCTLKEINLKFDEEIGIINCDQYAYDHEKNYECMDCQLEKYGELEFDSGTEFDFIQVDNIEDLFE